jgi:lipoprotein NlpI
MPFLQASEARRIRRVRDSAGRTWIEERRPPIEPAPENRNDPRMKIRFALLGLLCACLGVGVSATEDAAALLARARELARSGQFAEALPLFTRVTELEPQNYRGHAGRGSMLNYLHRYREGLAAIERAVELAPDNPLLYFNRGLSRAEVGRFAEAIADFDRAIAGRPDLPMPYADRGAARLSLGEFDAALADTAAALRADPNYIWAKYYRAQAHYLQGDYVSAAADFSAVARDQPAFPAAALWRYLAERRAGAPGDGHALHAGASSDWPAVVRRFFAGEVDDAALLRAARDQRVVDDERRESAAHVYLGLQHLFRGDAAAARTAFTRALEFLVPAHFEQLVARAELARLR